MNKNLLNHAYCPHYVKPRPLTPPTNLYSTLLCTHKSHFLSSFYRIGAFEDDDVTHIEGDVNPVRDLEIIGEELRLKDEEMLEKNLEKLERTVLRGGDKKMKPEYVSVVQKKTVGDIITTFVFITFPLLYNVE